MINKCALHVSSRVKFVPKVYPLRLDKQETNRLDARLGAASKIVLLSFVTFFESFNPGVSNPRSLDPIHAARTVQRKLEQLNENFIIWMFVVSLL